MHKCMHSGESMAAALELLNTQRTLHCAGSMGGVGDWFMRRQLILMGDSLPSQGAGTFSKKLQNLSQYW